MPDRIYTFQQGLTIQLIEGMADLLTMPQRPRRLIQERFRALWRLAEKDRALPDRLRPRVYFSSRGGLWDGRVMVADIYEWLVDLHAHYDAATTRTAAR